MSEAQEKNGQQGAEGSNGSGGFGFWITVSAAAISVGTVILMLLGYGVSLAVEGKFGIPHATVFESGFELLDLASIVFFSSFLRWGSCSAHGRRIAMPTHTSRRFLHSCGSRGQR
ncbi:MAG: hypothetical protein QG619_156 [Pseudomonadota bacterium]|nr:hypothetical protein [Pseudomonadota bacterium]